MPRAADEASVTVGVSDPNAFTGVDLDRAGDGRRRDPDWLEAQLCDPAAQALHAGDAGLRMDGERLRRTPLDELEGPGARGELVLLGLGAGGPLYVLDEDLPSAEPKRPPLIGGGGRRGEISPAEPGWIGLREAAGSLDRADGGLAAYAAAILNWHRSNRFCSICGSPTVPSEGGDVRSCPRCGTSHHPRIDPVVIMLVTRPGALLLGRQHSWPERRYSALAGFVSPGESLEEAVAREVREEAGVEVDVPRFVSSQPWPFPSSLMIGFVVPWRAGEPGGTDPELEDVRWFERAAVAEAAERDERWDGATTAGELQLPPRSAIARRLVEGWLARG